MRRRFGVASAVTVLAPLTACTVAAGGGSSDHGLKRPPEPSPAATVGGLKAAALSGADVAGFTVKVPGDGAAPRREDVAAEERCAPVAFGLVGAVVGKAEETVTRQVVDAKGAATTVTLGAYEKDGAQQAMTELSDAVEACAKGFDVSVKGERQRVTKVDRELAPQGAEQAMAFGITTDKGTVKLVVARKGGALGYFTAPVLPQAVVDAQLVKLG
ncbi:hypothetical protein ACIRNI_01205 [Streptomyces sp. NPDC093546]|uniref:hypothetical protein n=1 Tax=Streptomyces sp. NPDC093546 TaxID=3366040 RepID=UPI0037FBB11C